MLLFLVVPGGTRKLPGSPGKAHGGFRVASRVPPVPPEPGSKNLKTYTFCSPLLSRRMKSGANLCASGLRVEFRRLALRFGEEPLCPPPHLKVWPDGTRGQGLLSQEARLTRVRVFVCRFVLHVEFARPDCTPEHRRSRMPEKKCIGPLGGI